MTPAPRVRRVALVAHVAASVGWLGAVVAFIGLAVIGLAADGQTARSAYVVMEPAAWLVLAPLALASLVTGLVQSLATPWGLFRHYWVVAKLLINLFATIVLLVYMDTFEAMAQIAADPRADLAVVRTASPAVHGVLALALLLVATTLAVVKPRGLTPYGQRRAGRSRQAATRDNPG